MVQLHEQVLRDAHQSLIATRMRTEDMLPICPDMDQVGYFSMEVWGGATFDVCIRYLNEDPWERLKKLKEALPNTPLQMLERAMNIVAYRNFPDDIVQKFIHYAHRDGVEYFRIFDALNDMRNLERPIQYVKEEGAHAQGSLSYTISPVHTVERYIDDLLILQKMGCDSICIKDMAGLITPTKAYDIIKGSKDAGVTVPINLHTHCTSGMFGLSYMRACQAEVDILDTAISPFSGGTAQPPTESVVAALKDTPYDTGYDLDLLMKIRRHFLQVWDKYSAFHKINALRFDPSVTTHQIPGGMLSNLMFQLEQQGAGDKYEQVLAEVPRVRQDLGYPPLVTPTSQLVGIQAVMNVLFGRYKKVPTETKDYVRGMYGQPPGEISEEMYRTILGPDWQDEVVDCRPSDLLEPMFDQRKRELEEQGVLRKPEDVLTYAIYPQVGLKFLKGEAREEELTSRQEPVVRRPSFPAAYAIDVNGVTYNVEVKSADLIQVNGIPHSIKIKSQEQTEQLPDQKQEAVPAQSSGETVNVKSPMMGSIIRVNVSVGDRVKKGDLVAVLEAMKMENDVTAPASGVVKSLNVSAGKDVEAGTVIAVIET